MNDSLARRPAARPRKLSAAAADSGANVSLQHGEVTEVIEVIEGQPARETQVGASRPGTAAGIGERRNSAPLVVHQRHMPMEPKKFHIPRKTKEKRALFTDVSTESREFEDMMNILTSSYFDNGSAGCFTYCKPRVVYSEPLEKEFVEKRREMKMDGRTDTELEESYGFMLVEAQKVHQLCENGLCVSQSWITVLGNPSKGVYLSRYSDLLQINPFTPGATGELIIFKVMKGKVKSIYENMKNILDPTPRFDSHIFKNASKVTSLTSYRAFEFTQHYFYEYLFDELRQRPRQVCPYAVVSLLFKGKDTPLLRMNSQTSEGSKERAQFTVWTGDLVKGDQVLFQISLRAFSPPLLPHRLPEKLKIGCVMRFDQVTKLLPSSLFSYNLYNSSQEVVEDGHCCSLLEVVDRSRSSTSVTKLLQELEMKRVVLVTPLTERGFLFLLSSVQMAAAPEQEGNWKRCLQALFVFPETRDVAKSTLRRASAAHDASVSVSGATVMPHLSTFIPALHHALVKTRANPIQELSASVERQAKEYLNGLKDGKVWQYPMGEYVDEQEEHLPAPKHHKDMDYYLRSYVHNPTLYLLSVARVRQVLDGHRGPEEPQQVRPRKSCVGQRESLGKEGTGNSKDGLANTKKLQQLVDLVLTCKRNAENEVKREEGSEGSLKGPGRKRRLEQQAAARALKFLKATQEPGRDSKIPVDGSQTPASPDLLTSVIGSVGLRDVDLREDGSELAAKLLMLLTGLKQAAKGAVSQEEGPQESSPFDRLATKLGLPINCDIDLRKQEELEEQTAGSVSSLEGFSPSSHSGEMNHRGGRGLGRGTVYGDDEEDEEIPWVLIPITGLCSDRYCHRERNIPKDPRFQHLSMTTGITPTTKPPETSPALSPEPSPPPLTLPYPSPRLSPPSFPTQCPSPDPSPPLSPSQCPSPEPSPSPSPSYCPSPEPSPPASPSQCPSLQPPRSPSQHTAPSPSRCQSSEPVQHIPPTKGNSANEERSASTEIKGISRDRRGKPQETAKKNEEPSVFSAIPPTVPPAPSPPLSAKEILEIQEKMERDVVILVEEVQKQREEKATECKGDGEELVDVLGEVVGEKKRKEEQNEMEGGSLSLSPSESSPPPPLPLRDIDSIVDKHLGNFSSEMQLLLQEESIHYSFPQSPHSTSNPETSAPQRTLPRSLASHFSEYVSSQNPCPPVHAYVSSLKDDINSMLAEFGEMGQGHSAGTSRTNADNTLASSVSAFVSSIRAANTHTDSDGKASAPCGELTAAHPGSSVSQTPALSRGGEACQPDANSWKPPTSNVTLSTSTSASGSVYKSTDPASCHPPSDQLSQSHWKPQQGHMSEIDRTGDQNIRTAQDGNFRITQCAAEAGRGGTELTSNLTPPGSSSISLSPHPAELVSNSASVSTFAPPTTALNSLINQLQPEVFSSLVKIIKDVKKRSVQFYLHSTEARDPLLEDIKEHLLNQGNIEQSPVDFLNRENPDNRLLVIIKNKDIAGHIHKIPNLVSLKRRSSVVFVGIDTLGDIRNNSYNELFVSGGCIVSDEMILNPDFISHGQLAELLLLLERHSSLESIWKWKVHCKTHRKLKEQASFRREAANMLDLLSAYQKRQVVEFLPYHRCDMTNHQSPDLDCLIELQARYTQCRHTIFLTEHCHERLPAYASGGIIVAGIEEILQDFSRLVGYHDIKDKQPAKDILLATKGLGLQLTQGDSASGSEHSPSIFPEHIHPLSCSEKSKHLTQQPGSGPIALRHLSDQLVPDTSLKDGAPQPSHTDFEVLRQAISQLRAERQAERQRQLESQCQESSIDPQESLLSNSVTRGSGHAPPPAGQGGRTDSSQLTPSRKAVADTLDLIHSTLQLGEQKRPDRVEPPAEGQGRGGVGLSGGKSAPRISGTFHSSSNDDAATAKTPNDETGRASAGREQAFSKAAASGTFSCAAEDNRSRDAHSGQQQLMRAEGVLTRNSDDSEVARNHAPPQLQQVLLHPPPPPAHIRQQQWSMGLVQPRILPQIHSQFSAGPTLRPGLLGATPAWPGGLVWGIPQAPSHPALLGVYHHPAAQGNSRYRGGQRGGFHGM